ncbi:hypothetical protein ACFPIJ_55190 [Dactylosporangium cerinum]|uniref:Uncharacterized protein n=1 Tax=Dactylosporangium cerinum TaxID=1434730 RepID=A0ABV9WDX3_9ACTN
MTTLSAVTAAALAAYALACWIAPFGRCQGCKGTGTRQTFLTHRYRPCRWCRGAGLRLRIGRRLYNFAARIHHDATAHRDAR